MVIVERYNRMYIIINALRSRKTRNEIKMQIGTRLKSSVTLLQKKKHII